MPTYVLWQVVCTTAKSGRKGRDGSFATDAFRASVEQCPLCAESDNSRHESEL